MEGARFFDMSTIRDEYGAVVALVRNQKLTYAIIGKVIKSLQDINSSLNIVFEKIELFAKPEESEIHFEDLALLAEEVINDIANADYLVAYYRGEKTSCSRVCEKLEKIESRMAVVRDFIERLNAMKVVKKPEDSSLDPILFTLKELIVKFDRLKENLVHLFKEAENFYGESEISMDVIGKQYGAVLNMFKTFSSKSQLELS